MANSGKAQMLDRMVIASGCSRLDWTSFESLCGKNGANLGRIRGRRMRIYLFTHTQQTLTTDFLVSQMYTTFELIHDPALSSCSL